MKRNFGRSNAKKQSSFVFGKNMSGCVRRYSTHAVVPHFGAPTMKRFGTRGGTGAAFISQGFLSGLFRAGGPRRTAVETRLIHFREIRASSRGPFLAIRPGSIHARRNTCLDRERKSGAAGADRDSTYTVLLIRKAERPAAPATAARSSKSKLQRGFVPSGTHAN